jgi:hypothetical protein
MYNSSIRKAKVLGIPFGTATARLKKSLLFLLVVETKRNFCYKCNLEIKTEDELSIEHKIPWETSENAKELFYDLNNIAFSHLKCNKRSFIIDKRKKIGPEGTAWCIKHKDFLPIYLFSKNSNHWNGLDHMCKECQNIKMKKIRSK